MLLVPHSTKGKKKGKNTPMGVCPFAKKFCAFHVKERFILKKKYIPVNIMVHITNYFDKCISKLIKQPIRIQNHTNFVNKILSVFQQLQHCYLLLQYKRINKPTHFRGIRWASWLVKLVTWMSWARHLLTRSNNQFWNYEFWIFLIFLINYF